MSYMGHPDLIYSEESRQHFAGLAFDDMREGGGVERGLGADVDGASSCMSGPVDEAGCRIDDAPRIAVFPLKGVKLPEDFRATFTAVLDDDTKITAQYDALFDATFADQPAWAADDIQPAIRAIVAKMKGIL